MSVSHFWEPPTQLKRTTKAKPQRKHGNTEAVESVVGKSRRTFRKASIVMNAGNSVSEMDKLKNNPRKAPASNQQESAQEQPQNELERVKCSLRKITASATTEATEKTEIAIDKHLQPLQSVKITNSDIPEHGVVITSENLAASDIVGDKGDPLEAPLNMTADELVDAAQDNNIVVDTHSLENGVKMESAPALKDELSCKEEKSGKEDSNKVRKRRSLPAKQECPENVSQNSPSLPSYMAATESAKAKLRAVGSPKFGEEEGAESGFTCRHSLPAPANGKLSSLSPRLAKCMQANGKGGSKTNKSLMSSRDDKVVQPGWRR